MGAFNEISVMANRIHLPKSIVVSVSCMVYTVHQSGNQQMAIPSFRFIVEMYGKTCNRTNNK